MRIEYNLGVELVKKREHIWGDMTWFDTERNTQLVPVIKSGNYIEEPNYVEIADQDWVSIEVNLDKTLVQTVYSPDSIFVGLTKIGALFALSKIFIIFSVFHEYRFEKQLERDTEEICSDLEKSHNDGYQVNNHLTTMTIEE
jgi:hypothetical protein